ncbi:uncharacterized protein BHQ10_010200 [Talaromyces amestolkiae]|uniref:CHAT domain-containing protein n=1 Tax=Talaromyces amestolkiae TaxID=1196081 RepID=A0A364LEE5_TALAM|nr:uncharacterized protein BHQ10_010200 [Talaromyces amestolkiae]RAO74188.1 hypothetical protein BHQ10_010200 [Talaromyces amestolkiae]
MDFVQFCSPFGGSLFTEEYRGDIRKGDENLKHIASSLNGDNDEDSLAALILQQSCLCMLRGNNAEAMTHIERLEQCTNLSPRWRLRKEIYRILCVTLRRYPPIIRNIPSDFTQPWGVKVPIVSVSKEFSEAFAQYRRDSKVDDTTTFECLFLLAAINFPGFLRTARVRNPNYPTGKGGRIYQEMKEKVIERFENLQWFQKTCANAGMQRLSQYLKRLEVELQFAIGSSDKGIDDLRALEREYERSGDWAGCAACKLLEADYALTSPFSTPFAFNLIPVYSGNAGFVSQVWDETEDKLSLLESDELSQKLLQQAHDLFQKSDSPRGRAAVRLRQGCIEHMKCYSSACTPNERTGFLQAAKEHFTDALHLFDLDEVHCQIVRGHQMMLLISGHEDMKTVTSLAREIGSWGIRSNNEGISEFIGSLLIRFGRRLLYQSEVNKALMCFEAARECFSAMEEQYGTFQAMISTITVHSLTQNNLHARYLIEHQTESFYALLNYFDGLCDSDPLYKGFRTTKVNVIISYDSVVSPVYRNLGDFEALKKWRAEVKQLLKKDNMTMTFGFREALGDPFLNNYFGKAGHSLVTVSSSWASSSFNFFHSAPTLVKRFVNLVLSYLTGRSGSSSKEDVSEPEPKEETFFDKLHRAHSIMDDYSITIGRYRDLILTANVDEAEHVLRSFYASLVSMTPTFSTKVAGILVGIELGDSTITFKNLEMLNDEDLLGEWTLDKYAAVHHTQTLSSNANQHFRSQPHFENALYFCVLAGQWDRGYKLLHIIESTNPDFFDIRGWREVDMWHRFASAGLIAGRKGEVEKGFKYLLQALKLVESFRGNIGDKEARRSMISTAPIINITNALIFLCLECRKSDLPLTLISNNNFQDHSHARTWDENFLLFYERSRARSLLDSLRLQELGERLTAAEDNTNKIYKHAKLRHLRSLAIEHRMQGIEMPEMDQQELSMLENELRPDDGVLDYQQPMLSISLNIDPKDLYGAISDDALVIAIPYSLEAVYELAITAEKGILFAEKINILPAQFRSSAIRLLSYIRKSKDVTVMTQNMTSAPIRDLLQELSAAIILPIQGLIRSKHHIIFVMSFPLIGFPVGALALDGKPLCIQKAISQIPSLSSLLYLSKRSADKPRKPRTYQQKSQFVSSISKVSSWAEYEAKPMEPLLPMAGIESVAISHLFNIEPIKANEMDREKFRKVLNESRVLHVATHGVFESRSPWTMNLLLKEKVRALDLFEAQSNADLVVFSACSTGMGTVVGNEVLGFSHVLLEAGCSSYLGALWEVNDIATMLMMVLFFRQIRQCLDDRNSNVSAAELWRLALEDFYNMNPKRARGIIQDLIHIWKNTAPAARQLVQGGMVYLKKLSQCTNTEMDEAVHQGVDDSTDPLDLNYQHPYLYASFALIGNGALRLLRSEECRVQSP